MSTVTADIDGQEFTVDLHRVTGLDALSYRHETGGELDALVGAWASADRGIIFLADVAVVRWLWERQNINPLASLAVVAASVPMLPAVEAGAVDAPEVK